MMLTIPPPVHVCVLTELRTELDTTGSLTSPHLTSPHHPRPPPAAPPAVTLLPRSDNNGQEDTARAGRENISGNLLTSVELQTGAVQTMLCYRGQ